MPPAPSGRFRDRHDAGRQLAGALNAYAGRSDVVVLGLPRGGVPVAAEIAARLAAPLDIFVVRKVGVPGHQELAMGAVAAGVEVFSRELIQELGIPEQMVRQSVARERLELERREAIYRRGRLHTSVPVHNQTVLLVDDGLATGSTMHAAVLALRQLEPARIVVAVPVGAHDTCERLRGLADEVVCLRTPEPFDAVGLWYDEFGQTTDDEVRQLLAAQDAERPR